MEAGITDYSRNSNRELPTESLRPSKDGHANSVTNALRKSLDQTSSCSRKRHRGDSNVDEWDTDHHISSNARKRHTIKDNGSDARNYRTGDSNAKRYDGLGKTGPIDAVDRNSTPEPRKRCSGDGNYDREFNGFDAAVEKARKHLWKHQSRDGTSKRELDGWDKAPDKCDPNVRKQDGPGNNVKRETDGWGTPVTQERIDVWEHHSRGIIDKIKTDGWGTWGTTDGLGGSDAKNHHTRDDNAKREKNEPAKAHRQTTPDSWMQHAGNTIVKNDTDAWDKTLNKKGTPKAWKHHSGHGNVNRVTDSWGAAPEQANKGSMKHHSTYGNCKRPAVEFGKTPDRRDRDERKQYFGEDAESRNAKRETTGWGKAPDRNDVDSWKQQGVKSNAKIDTDGWGKWNHHEGKGSVEIETNEWGKRNHHEGKGNVEIETNEWGKAPDSSDPDARKQHTGEGNIKQENVECSATVKQNSHDIWEQLSKDANTKRETSGWGTDGGQRSDGWGSTVNQNDAYSGQKSDGWGSTVKQHCAVGGQKSGEWDSHVKHNDADAGEKRSRDSNIKKETGGCGSTVEQNGPDVQEQLSKDAYTNRGTDGARKSGGWNSTGKLSGAGVQEQHSKNPNIKKETGNCSSIVKQNGPDVWEKLSKDANTNRETKGWGTWGANSGQRSDGWGSTVKQKDPDAWEQPSKYSNIKKETDECSLTAKQNGDDVQEKLSKDAYTNRETSVWGIDGAQKSGGWNSTGKLSDAGVQEQHSKNPNIKKETGGCSSTVKQNGPDVWEKLSEDANTNRETKGWGTWGANGGQRSDGWGSTVKQKVPVAWEQPSKDANISRETGGWGRDLAQKSVPDAWNHHRETGPNTINPWKQPSRSISPGSAQNRIGTNHGLGSWNNHGLFGAGRSREACRNFLAGRCGRGSQCRYFHEGNGHGHFDPDISAIGESRYEKGKNPTVLPDDGDRHELHRVQRFGPCFDFLKGRCYRGTRCKFTHDDASTGGGPVKYEAKEKLLNRTRNSPEWGDQTASANASNSSNGSRANAAQSMEMEYSINTPLPHLAESCTMTLQSNSKINKNRQMLEENSVHIKSSQMYPGPEIEDMKKVELNRDTAKGMDGEGTAQSKKEPAIESKDEIDIRKFKIALAEFVKDILKPVWKEGHLSKEVHKIIVKKAVDKVIGVLPVPNIPRTREQIVLYISYCETKLRTLVKEYLQMYVRAEPMLGKSC